MWINRGTELLKIELERAKKIELNGRYIELYNSLDETATSYQEIVLKLPADATKLFGILVDILTEGLVEPIEIEPQYTEQSIEYLFLPEKEKNYLIHSGLDTIEKIAQKNERQLRQIRGIGRKTIHRIEEGLKQFGLSLK